MTNKALTKVHLILYAQIGTKEFDQFHKFIVNLAETNSHKYQLDYVLRHNYRESKHLGKVALSGYGVELDIKNVEYKAGDDTKVNAKDSTDENSRKTGSQSSSADDEPVNGFMFNRLKELNPTFVDRLDELRKHLIESTFELAPLKAWQMQDLSLQAAQRIIDAESDDALSILEDLAQNYPIRARSLSKIQVRSDLRKTLKSQRGVLEKELQMEAGAGALYLNGMDLGIDTVDIFGLSTTLKKEAKLVESLHKIGLSTSQIKDLIYLDTSSKNNDYGIDIRDSSIQWVNDLEADSKYSYWTKDMQVVV